jgi:hypothetical protein
MGQEWHLPPCMCRLAVLPADPRLDLRVCVMATKSLTGSAHARVSPLGEARTVVMTRVWLTRVRAMILRV